MYSNGTPLHAAADGGLAAVVEQLLAQGADKDALETVTLSLRRLGGHYLLGRRNLQGFLAHEKQPPHRNHHRDRDAKENVRGQGAYKMRIIWTEVSRQWSSSFSWRP